MTEATPAQEATIEGTNDIEGPDETWMSAWDALEFVSQSMPPHLARRAICSRAYAELVRARAKRFLRFDEARDNFEIPSPFWWAKGGAALTQNWATGDFETWIARKLHVRAFGVEFRRKDIEALVGKAVPVEEAVPAEVDPEPDGGIPETAPEPLPEAKPRGGRRPANWWDDLWAEIGAQIYLGDLKPECQADIEGAMLDWIEGQGFSASQSTVRERARKLFKAIEKKG